MPRPEPLHEVHAIRNDGGAERADDADDGSAELPQPISGTRAQKPSAPRPSVSRLSPDEEAMQLMMKILERLEVAKSFARIAAGILTVSAARASVQVRAVAEASGYDKVRKIARAAKDAAVHVATHRPDPEKRQGAENEKEGA